jgi:two-component system, NtrC family, sensor kinase
LGLSICYGIIKKMGGDISVRSVMDEGTTFTIKLALGKTGAEK